MDNSRKRNFERQEQSEHNGNSGYQQPTQESGSRVFRATNQIPFQNAMYTFVPRQEQQTSGYGQAHNPFVMGSQTSDNSYNGSYQMAASRAMNHSPSPTAIPHQPKRTSQTTPSAEYMQAMSSYYPQAQFPQATDMGAFSRAYSPVLSAPVNGMQAPLGPRQPAGVPGYHLMGKQASGFAQGLSNSPDPSNVENHDENIENQTSIKEERTDTGVQIQAPQSNFMTAALRFQYLRKYHSDRALLQLHEFIDKINRSAPHLSDTNFWRKTMNDMFTPRATLRYTRKMNSECKFFEISALMMPMMWVALSTLDISKIEIMTTQVKADTLSNGSVFFHCPSLTFSYNYSDGSQITYHAHMKGSFNTALKLEWLDVLVHKFTPGLSWNSMEKVLKTRPETLLKLSQKLIQAKEGNAKSNEGGRDIKSEQDLDIQETLKDVRSSFTVFKNITDEGIHEGMMRVLQVGDVMSALTDVYLYQKEKKIKSPLESLNLYVKNLKEGASSGNAAEDDRNAKDNYETKKSKTSHSPNDQMAPTNASPACSPRDTKGVKTGGTEAVPPIRRKRSTKAVSRAGRTPSDEDRNSIPGTKKIKF